MVIIGWTILIIESLGIIRLTCLTSCLLIIFFFVQSDLLIVKKKNKRYCPIYFTKVCIISEELLIMDSSSFRMCNKKLVWWHLTIFRYLFRTGNLGRYRKGTVEGLKGIKRSRNFSTYYGMVSIFFLWYILFIEWVKLYGSVSAPCEYGVLQFSFLLCILIHYCL